MTYQDLYDRLTKARRIAPELMASEIFFMAVSEDRPRPVRSTEYNDGSIKGIPAGAIFLSEV